MRAFSGAVDAGADMIEMDVRLSRDGQVVVVHDANLARLFGDRGRISALAYDAIRVRSKGAVPLLSEVLERFKRRIQFCIELKAARLGPGRRQRLVDETGRAIRQSGTNQACVVASFDYRAVRLFRDRFEGVRTGFIFFRASALTEVRGCRFRGVDVVCPHKEQLTPDLMEEMKKMGKRVFPWVLDILGERRRAIRLGVDGIVTNDPLSLRRLLRDDQPGRKGVPA